MLNKVFQLFLMFYKMLERKGIVLKIQSVIKNNKIHWQDSLLSIIFAGIIF